MRVLEENAGGDFDPALVGDPFVLPRRFEDLPVSQVAGLFGPDFAGELDRLEPGGWRGPIASGYGLHLVRVDARKPGRLPSLDEIEPIVRRELLAERRRETNLALYRSLRERYHVTVEWPEGMEPVPLEQVIP
jgi:hypothetical protein